MSATAPPAGLDAETSSRRLTRARTFPVVASVIVLFMAAAGAPTPLYVVYQQAWGFTPTTLTVVFAVYVIGLLGSLLVVGGLSDHVGRRPHVRRGPPVDDLQHLRERQRRDTRPGRVHSLLVDRARRPVEQRPPLRSRELHRPRAGRNAVPGVDHTGRRPVRCPDP